MGCQGYERRPLDIDAARAAWLSRSAEDAGVRAFAASLAAREGRSEGGFDPADGLSLPEAEAVMLVFNAELRVARLRAGVTRATSEHAGAWQDPSLGVDLERIVSGAGGSSPWVAGATIGLTVPISGRLGAEKARAGAALAAELERLAAMEWATRAALRELWVEWSAAGLKREVTGELVARLREVVSLAERMGQAGLLSRIEARVFRVELAGREADLIDAQARERELELQVRAMLGLPPGASVALVPTVAFAGRAANDEGLRASSPELAVVRADYEVAERSLRAEIRRQYPDLTIGPGYGTDEGDERVLLSLAVPLPLWNRNRGGIAEAAAERELARGRFEAAYERLAGRLAIAEVRADAARARRESIERTAVPLAGEQEADVRRTAELGRVDPLLLLAALETQHEVRVRLIDARAAEAVGAIRLDELLGPPAQPGTGPSATGSGAASGEGR